MVESIIVMLLACLVFFAVFQYAHLFACKTVLSHAAARGARARTVGFNEWMVRKSALVAAIPASGKRLAPQYSELNGAFVAAVGKTDVGKLIDFALHSNLRANGYAIEAGRIPEFMESINEPSSQTVLDYAYWDRTDVDINETTIFNGEDGSLLAVRVRQHHPLLIDRYAMEEGKLRSVNEELYRDGGDGTEFDDGISISGQYSIENHYPLYLEDAKW